MILNKITTGYVVQSFDTETQKWVSQEFIAGDECEYEDTEGNPVDSSDLEGETNPYLPYDMVQPELYPESALYKP